VKLCFWFAFWGKVALKEKGCWLAMVWALALIGPSYICFAFAPRGQATRRFAPALIVIAMLSLLRCTQCSSICSTPLRCAYSLRSYLLTRSARYIVTSFLTPHSVLRFATLIARRCAPIARSLDISLCSYLARLVSTSHVSKPFGRPRTSVVT
jgi:hypothetical protein